MAEPAKEFPRCSPVGNRTPAPSVSSETACGSARLICWCSLLVKDHPLATAGGSDLLHSDNPPVIIRFGGNVLFSLDPVDNQLAHFFARTIDDRRVPVHREAAAAVDAIVVSN